jgi:hypothetical protein
MTKAYDGVKEGLNEALTFGKGKKTGAVVHHIEVMSDDGMDQEDFEGLIAGLRDVAAYERGERDGFVTNVPTSVDVGAARASIPGALSILARAGVGQKPVKGDELLT